MLIRTRNLKAYFIKYLISVKEEPNCFELKWKKVAEMFKNLGLVA